MCSLETAGISHGVQRSLGTDGFGEECPGAALLELEYCCGICTRVPHCHHCCISVLSQQDKVQSHSSSMINY